MALRLGSFKTRTALANALAVAAILVANSVYLLLAERAELERTRETIEEHATTFARLTEPAIGRAFERHLAGEAGFLELIRSYLSLEPSLQQLRVVLPSGETLFDSRRPGDGGDAEPRPPRVNDPELAEAARQRTYKKLP